MAPAPEPRVERILSGVLSRVVHGGPSFCAALGVRSAELNAGINFLRTLSVGGRLVQSQRIETVPVDCPAGSLPFLNAVAGLIKPVAGSIAVAGKTVYDAVEVH